MKAVHERLLKYQNDNNHTQHVMAKLLGTSQTTYNNWLNVPTPITPRYYPAIAKILKVDIGDLISPTTTVSISNGTSSEHKFTVNAKELYDDFIKHLKETNQSQKIEIERLQKRVTELEGLLRK